MVVRIHRGQLIETVMARSTGAVTVSRIPHSVNGCASHPSFPPRLHHHDPRRDCTITIPAATHALWRSRNTRESAGIGAGERGGCSRPPANGGVGAKCCSRHRLVRDEDTLMRAASDRRLVQ